MTAAIAPQRPDSPALTFPAFECGCRPYFEAHTYDAWQQYGAQVNRGTKAHRIPDVRDRLFCRCQVSAKSVTISAAVANPPPLAVVPAADPEPLTAAELALFEAAETVAAETESSLLDAILGSPSGYDPQPVTPAPVVQVETPKAIGQDLASLVANLAGPVKR